MSDHNTFYGVDRSVIEASMRRARRERSEAVWAILQRVFSRPEAAARDAAKDDAKPVLTGAACAHC